MNLGKKLAEGYAVDTERVDVPEPAETAEAAVTVSEGVDAPVVTSAQPVTA
ncbi:hypothetical protein [Pseudonocardia sp.]|uniref:hypothetical protein n=1 Tax=Pseudonocardia sp. TaxID=60912 RepID=UPI003D12CCAF